MDKFIFKMILLSQDYEHGGGGISRPDMTRDFADIMRMVFSYLQSYVFEFPFNGRIWTFTLWQVIKFDAAIAIGIYIISKIWDISLKRFDIWV